MKWGSWGRPPLRIPDTHTIKMRCPVLLLLVIRVAWGATSSPSSPSAGEPALQTPGAPDLLQPDSPRKAAPSILDIFPQDLLTSRSRIKPLDIRRIEHDHFIDYEVEFVELPEEESEANESDNLVISHSESEDHGQQGGGGGGLLEDSKVNMESFADLLQRARIRHRTKISTDRRRRRRIKLRHGNGSAPNLVAGKEKQKLELASSVYKSQPRRKVQPVEQRRRGGVKVDLGRGREPVGRLLTGVGRELSRQGAGRRLGRKPGLRGRKRIPLGRRRKLGEEEVEGIRRKGESRLVTTTSNSLLIQEENEEEEETTTMMYPAFISTPSPSSREATTVHSRLPDTPSPIPIALLSIFGSGHQPYSNSQPFSSSSSSLSYGSNSNQLFGQAYGVESPPKLEALRVSPSPNNVQPQRVFAPIFTTVAPERDEFLENTATVVPKTSTTTPLPTTTTTTRTSTTPVATTISEMTTTTSMYYTSVSLSQSQSVSTSVVKPAWARRLVFTDRDKVKERKDEDLVTSESVPRLQLHSVVTMVYPGVYNTASNNQRGMERKTTKGPEVYNTAASNTNNAFTHRPVATSSLATTEPTTIAIVPTTTLTTTTEPTTIAIV